MYYADAFRAMEQGKCAMLKGKYYIIKKDQFRRKRLYYSTDGENWKRLPVSILSDPFLGADLISYDWRISDGDCVEYNMTFIDVIIKERHKKEHTSKYMNECSDYKYKWINGKLICTGGRLHLLSDEEIRAKWKELEW